MEPEPASDTVSEVLDTSLTPAALKKLSRSVMDLSAPSLSDVTDISKSTASVFTDGGRFRKILKGGKKTESTASLVSETTTLGSVDSPSHGVSSTYSTLRMVSRWFVDSGDGDGVACDDGLADDFLTRDTSIHILLMHTLMYVVAATVSFGNAMEQWYSESWELFSLSIYIFLFVFCLFSLLAQIYLFISYPALLCNFCVKKFEGLTQGTLLGMFNIHCHVAFTFSGGSSEARRKVGQVRR